MSTKHNSVLEDEGVDYVARVVRKHNCLFQQVDYRNDLGNDAYIEFITDRVATSFCTFTQIKAGKSYRDGKGYKFQANQAHLEYWCNHLNPEVGIVYDESQKEAYWINLSEYFESNPQVLSQKTHVIRISPQNRFSDFGRFKEHFVQYIQSYKSLENFGRSLQFFSKVDQPEICHDGLKSLYSNHRDKRAAWYYLISCFRQVHSRTTQMDILCLISNFVPDGGFVFHTKASMKLPNNEGLCNYLAETLTACFQADEVVQTFEFLKEGVVFGSPSYRVYLTLSIISGVHKLLLQIANDTKWSREDRDFAFWLFIHFSQWKSLNDTVNMIDRHLAQNPDCENLDVLQGMRETMKSGEYLRIG